MTLVAGYPPEERSKAVLHLAAMLARSLGEDLVVATVVPRPWFPSMAKIDAEYQAHLDAQADAALNQARSELPDGVRATFVRRASRSVATGLLEAEPHDASIIVVGSSSAGAFGHVVLGSVTDRLLHSSPIPVAMAPRGFRAKPGATVRRVTAAYDGGEAAGALVLTAAGVAARAGAALRLASFAVWSRPSHAMRLGTEPEDAVLQVWLAEIRDSAGQALARVKDSPAVPRDLGTVVGIGSSWVEALEDVEWDEGEVLVVGSSSVGPIAGVFLGTRSAKIVRHSPVPVLVVPRAAGTAEVPDISRQG